MTQMAIPMAGTNLRPDHAVTGIVFLDDIAGLSRLGETGPAAPGVELIERGKQRLSGDDIDVEAFFLVVPKGIFERPFGSTMLRHAILLRRKAGQGFGVLRILR